MCLRTNCRRPSKIYSSMLLLFSIFFLLFLQRNAKNIHNKMIEVKLRRHTQDYFFFVFAFVKYVD